MLPFVVMQRVARVCQRQLSYLFWLGSSCTWQQARGWTFSERTIRVLSGAKVSQTRQARRQMRQRHPAAKTFKTFRNWTQVLSIPQNMVSRSKDCLNLA